ncbi:MAG: nucleoside triphosphate pyrophosphohydrolase, partial [Candidatus Rokuibacteriota bacterium]
VNVARLADVDPEGALQAAVERFSRRFASMEDAARDEGRELSGLSLGELERLWSRAKALERPS